MWTPCDLSHSVPGGQPWSDTADGGGRPWCPQPLSSPDRRVRFDLTRSCSRSTARRPTGYGRDRRDECRNATRGAEATRTVLALVDSEHSRSVYLRSLALLASRVLKELCRSYPTFGSVLPWSFEVRLRWRLAIVRAACLAASWHLCLLVSLASVAWRSSSQRFDCTGAPGRHGVVRVFPQSDPRPRRPRQDQHLRPGAASLVASSGGRKLPRPTRRASQALFKLSARNLGLGASALWSRCSVPVPSCGGGGTDIVANGYQDAQELHSEDRARGALS